MSRTYEPSVRCVTRMTEDVKDKCVKLYTTEDLTVYLVAQRVSLSPAAVSKILRERGIVVDKRRLTSGR